MKNSFLKFFTQNTVMVFNLHGRYPKGTQCNDIIAMTRLVGALYQISSSRPQLDVRPYHGLSTQDRKGKNIISFGGPAANPLTKDLFANHDLSLFLYSGYIWDTARQWAVVQRYSSNGQSPTEDFGLITFISISTNKLQRLIIAGLKGTATDTAAYLLNSEEFHQELAAKLKQLNGSGHHAAASNADKHDTSLIDNENEYLQILIHLQVENQIAHYNTGRILKLAQRRAGKNFWEFWEHPDYNPQHLQTAVPLRIEFDPRKRPDGQILVNQQVVNVRGCAEWKEIVYFLSQARKRDFLKGGGNQGYRSQEQLKKHLRLLPEMDMRNRICRINRYIHDRTGIEHFIKSGPRGTGTYRVEINPAAIGFI